MLEKEIEVKVLGFEIQDYINMVEKIGAKKISTEDQVNHRFLDAKTEGESFLRLREVGGKGYFTLKEISSSQNARVSSELTTEISEPRTFLEIADKLGIVYTSESKKRIKYVLEDFVFDIDKWSDDVYPFPYMEIEAKSTEALQSIIARLGISEEHISTKSIKELKEDLNSL